jgi:hypothetical protein
MVKHYSYNVLPYSFNITYTYNIVDIFKQGMNLVLYSLRSFGFAIYIYIYI